LGRVHCGDHRADRVGQLDDVLEPACHRLDPAWIELQPIEHGGTQARGLRLAQILGVGSQNGARLGAHRGRGRAQCTILGGAGRQGQLLGGDHGRAADALHELAHIAFGRASRDRCDGAAHGFSSISCTAACARAAAPSCCKMTRSSRWISSSRPRNPSSAAISPLFRPMMRAASLSE
jgi:hypothetical protein